MTKVINQNDLPLWKSWNTPFSVELKDLQLNHIPSSHPPITAFC
ncbi:MAG: hypothetical protein QNJ46_33625 [Leptolyngbyaceae cyanobacterium MO_188.B28]|nr:hypothetical protein [Leptolyngbyaceae cyanobacterium MO_188.B28]